MKIEYSTTAKATPEQVWSVFSDLEGWSRWSNFFRSAKWLTGTPWTPSSEAALELAQPSFKLQVKTAEAAAPNKASYTANVMGVAVKQWFEFSPLNDGTLMKARIELNGPAVFLINEDMKKRGTAIFGQWFEAMKAEAEAKTGA